MKSEPASDNEEGHLIAAGSSSGLAVVHGEPIILPIQYVKPQQSSRLRLTGVIVVLTVMYCLQLAARFGQKPSIPMPQLGGVAPPVFVSSPSSNGTQQLDLVFTFDVTGSMGPYIDAAKHNIEAIVQKLTNKEKADLRFGLVAYRDHPPQERSFVVKPFPFTRSLAEMQSYLRTLQGTGGGDGPEAVEAAFQATLEMGWRADATKVVVWIADAPPHGLGEGGDGFPNGAPTGVDPLKVVDQMSASAICVYAVAPPNIGSFATAAAFASAVAQRTNGQAVALGSAAALADVILGGAIEEMEMERLAVEMQQTVVRIKLAQPGLSAEKQQAALFAEMRSANTTARQMKFERLASANAPLVTSSWSSGLSAVRTALKAAAPEPTRRGEFSAPMARSAAAFGAPMSSKYRRGGGGGDMEMRAAAMPASAMMSAEAASVGEEKVELAEREVSDEYAARLFSRGASKGLW